jgi:hypothetical protein
MSISTRIPRRTAPLLLGISAVALLDGACTPGDARIAGDSAVDSMVTAARARLDSLAQADSQVTSISFATKPRGRTLGTPRREWGAIEDTLVRFTVFAPATQTTYLAAVRAKRVLVDIGRVDLDMKEKPQRLAALKRVANALSPVAPGASFRLRHAWGTEEATVSGYDVWNGRLVATLAVSPRLDSLAQSTPALVAAAELLESPRHADSTTAATATAVAATDTTRAATADTTVSAGLDAPACVRDSVPAALLVRADSVRDSLLVEIAKRPIRIPRLARQARTHHTRVPGCFGPGRLVVAASMRAGAFEYLAERVVLLDSVGKVTPLTVRDYRFRVHDDLRAVDIDGDGIDDVAALGSGRGVGGTTVLRLDPAKKVLERAASGFGFDRQ